MTEKVRTIQMVDLRNQYRRIQHEINEAIQEVVESAAFINGPEVTIFAQSLEEYIGAKVTPCANGTDAIQIALMALGFERGDEIIVPAFTYAAAIEAIALLGLVPVFADVDQSTFNIDTKSIEYLITDKTKAILPVHLFGQCADMGNILTLAKDRGLYVIEDNAQSMGANYIFSGGNVQKAGTIGDIATTSFFPTKTLGCFGDGGAIISRNEALSKKCKMIANHGQSKKYIHETIGCNSRLDTLQAAILNVKLKHLDHFIQLRCQAANQYNEELSSIDALVIPKKSEFSTHVFHQYTIKLDASLRDELKDFLFSKGIPSMVYYPLPLHKQKAYQSYYKNQDLTSSELLCKEALSLPMHTELNEGQVSYITNTIKKFFL